MTNKKSKSFHTDTLVTLAGTSADNLGAVLPPVYRASTIRFNNMDELRESESAPFEKLNYGRLGTPSSKAIEVAVSELEGGYRAIASSSGLSIITTVLLGLAKSGGHILVSEGVYKGVSRFCGEILSKYQVEVEWYSSQTGDEIEKLIRPNTNLIYVESPSSSDLTLFDLPKIIDAAKKYHIPVIVDNTWATPLFYQPMTMGADIVIHSASKYLSGHADVIFGVAVCNQSSWKLIKNTSFVLGVHASADDAYLTLRGLRSLSARMKIHQFNALEVAHWFEKQPEVESVLHPGLESHPQHGLWKRDYLGASGRFIVNLRPFPAGRLDSMINSLEVFALGFSWGGFESIIMPEYEVDSKSGLADHTTLKVSVGLEHIDDLRQDLENGFTHLRSPS